MERLFQGASSARVHCSRVAPVFRFVKRPAAAERFLLLSASPAVAVALQPIAAPDPHGIVLVANIPVLAVCRDAQLGDNSEYEPRRVGSQRRMLSFVYTGDTYVCRSSLSGGIVRSPASGGGIQIGTPPLPNRELRVWDIGLSIHFTLSLRACFSRTPTITITVRCL